MSKELFIYIRLRSVEEDVAETREMGVDIHSDDTRAREVDFKPDK